jgi:hypothetical protein
MESVVNLQRLLNELTDQDGDDLVSLTIECPLDAPPRDRATFKDYLRVLDAAAATARRPLVLRLRDIPAVKIVELVHAPQVLVTAARTQWIDWLRPGGLIAETGVRVLPGARAIASGPHRP